MPGPDMPPCTPSSPLVAGKLRSTASDRHLLGSRGSDECGIFIFLHFTRIYLLPITHGSRGEHDSCPEMSTV